MSQDLPDTLPIFPLTGGLLLPRGCLPLNIFEPRYLAMVDYAFKHDRLIGMIQPKEENGETLYDVGCAGRIVHFEEVEDGRYEIKLKGVSRFTVIREIEPVHDFRVVETDWKSFEKDTERAECLNVNRERLTDLLRPYFEIHELQCDWNAVQDAPDDKLMTCLSMVCPFEPQEKQALLEARCCASRAELFITMLDMAVKSGRVTEIKH